MSYPKIYAISKIPRPRGTCKICGGHWSDTRIDVAVNNFRGDDDVYQAHHRCIKDFSKEELLNKLREEIDDSKRSN